MGVRTLSRPLPPPRRSDPPVPQTLRRFLTWRTVTPVLGLAALALTWAGSPPPWMIVIVGLLMAANVLAAVHHAEVVAHRVGEPFGSLVLAVAVTVIEVGLILMLMLAGKSGSESLARDTVFSAVIIASNGIVGLALLAARQPSPTATFNAEGSGAALATVVTLATVTMVLPTFTTSTASATFHPAQLLFAAVASLVVWATFVFTQTVQHRDFFLPVDEDGQAIEEDHHAHTPSNRAALASLGLLLGALVAVVGLAKVLSPSIEGGLQAVGLPHAFVGVVIAMLVLLPESLAAFRNSRRGHVQTGLNLAYGSAIASIGLTIPVIALLSMVLKIDLVLGLGPVHIVLLVLTGVVGILTVVPGRAMRLQGALHLVIMAAYVLLSAVP